MKSDHYKIFKNTFFDKGSKSLQFYTVKKKVKFFWWYRWVPLYRESYDGRDEARFDTEGDAAIAIKKDQMGFPMSGWREELVSELDFSKKNNGE